MKLVQTIASGFGFRDPDHNPTRLAALDALMVIAREVRADVVLLPGGFLTVACEAEMRAAFADVARRARAAGVAVVLGIDLPDTPTGKGTRAPVLPYYGAVCGATEAGPWRQTSSTGANAADVDDEDVPGEARVAVVAGARVGTLICGELFSWWAREAFVGLGLNLVLDLGHYGMGTGVTRAMENIARRGNCAVAHTHHVASWGGQSLHFVQPGGARESVPLAGCPFVGDDEFWVAWTPRTI